MARETLIEDLEHRRDLAGELARFADGSQGLGLGTALAGLMAIGSWALAALSGQLIIRFRACGPMTHDEARWFLQRQLLVTCAISLLMSLLWPFLRNRLQSRLYRNHGEARSAFPGWESRLGAALLGLLLCVGLWIAGSTFLALKAPATAELSPIVLWGASALKLMAATALSGTAILVAVSWRRVRGWRNWLGWISLCAPFLFLAAAPLMDDRHPRILSIALILALFAASLYCPFMAIYVGIRDHLRYRRLLKDLGALPSLEEQP